MIIMVISKKWWSDRYDGDYDDNHNHDNINTINQNCDKLCL